MIVVDSSVWIELLRGTGSRGHRTLRVLLERESELAVTEVVVLELLAGAPSERAARKLRSMLLAWPVLGLRGLDGYEAAASLWRACHAAGEPLRTHTDCLIAVPAIDAGASILTLDRDFETIARHSTLDVEPLVPE